MAKKEVNVGSAVVLIDEEDYELFVDSRCVLFSTGRSRNYHTVYSLKFRDYFHRVLLKVRDSKTHVDHIDNNPLNNQRMNLRTVTMQQNSWNTRPHKDSIGSKYKGVSAWNGDRSLNKWRCRIAAGDIKRVGYFKTEKEAALQYNEWAKELYGEFAYLNEITEVNDWKTSLQKGKLGEDLLLSIFPTILKKSDDLRWDFESNTGLKIDLKYDQYPSQSTNNLFIETIANTNKQSKGGPYKAIEDGVDYFVYMFRDSCEIFCFKPNELINKVEQIKHAMQPRNVKNSTYNTMGYAVPKHFLYDISYNIYDILEPKEEK